MSTELPCGESFHMEDSYISRGLFFSDIPMSTILCSFQMLNFIAALLRRPCLSAQRKEVLVASGRLWNPQEAHGLLSLPLLHVWFARGF